MLDAVLFDLDGTLLDTADDFLAIIRSMREQRGLPELPSALIRPSISDGSAGMLCAAFSITPEHVDFAALQSDFLQRYEQDVAAHTRLFPGMDDVLDWLDKHTIPWAVVTNKMSRFSIPLLKEVGLSARCASLVCPDQVSRAKPDPEPLFKACTDMGVEPTRCVYIGDHLRDIQAGRAAGMRTVAALYGYLPAGDDPQLWNADYTIENATALRPWLEQLKQQESCHV